MVHDPNGGIGCIRYRIGKGLSTAEQGCIPFINSVYDWIGLARRMYRWVHMVVEEMEKRIDEENRVNCGYGQ